MSNIFYLNNKSISDESLEDEFELMFEQLRNLTESVQFRMGIQHGHEMTGILGFPSANNNYNAIMQWIELNQSILKGLPESEWTEVLAMHLAEKINSHFENDWFGEG